MKVCIIGVGYVGLVTGVCLADIGHSIICVDNVEAKIEKLKKGVSPIYEPGLENFIEKNLKSGRLSFTTDIKYGVENSEIIFISVGTPSLSNGQADLSYVEAVAADVGKYINKEKIIVNKSTVPIGSGDWVSMIVSESIAKNNNNKNVKFHVVSNPWNIFSPVKTLLNKRFVQFQHLLYCFFGGRANYYPVREKSVTYCTAFS